MEVKAVEEFLIDKDFSKFCYNGISECRERRRIMIERLVVADPLRDREDIQVIMKVIALTFQTEARLLSQLQYDKKEIEKIKSKIE